jgi:alpha-tubulin suppressor-like RCC1 family protein
MENERGADLHPEEALEREAAGTLTPELRAVLDAHVADCAACAAERRLRADFTGLAASPRPGDDRLLAHAIAGALGDGGTGDGASARRSGADALPKLALVASAAALLGAGAAVWSMRQPGRTPSREERGLPAERPDETGAARAGVRPIPAFQAPSASATEPSAQLAAGRNHTCFLKGGGVFCWGRNRKGELGDGTLVDRSSPVPVLGLDEIESVKAGDGFTCALDRAGRVLCWGANNDGQLGAGLDDTQAGTPTPVAGLTDAEALWTGALHACARRRGGELVCWGANGSGQLGDGTLTSRRQPIAVAGVGPVSDMALGINLSCALEPAGRVSCWGSNRVGQLGDGQIVERRARPLPVVGLPPVTALAAGHVHVCATEESGRMWCWGWNQYGQLGDGTTLNRPTPVLALEGVVSMALANRQSCALDRDGFVSCWGLQGELRTGAGGALRPRRVPGFAGITSLAMGESHLCAIGGSGELRCVGGNRHGQLGAGSRASASEPVSVSTPY